MMWAERLVGEARKHFFGLGKEFFLFARNTEKSGLLVNEVGELLFQKVWMSQIADAQSAATDLIFVRGTDAAACRPDPAVPQLFFLLLLLQPVVRKNEVRAVAHEQIGADFDVEPTQHLHLGHERVGIDDAAVTDHGRYTRMQNSGRNDVEDELLTVHDDGVARVVATAITHHELHSPGQQVHVLSLALVTPLGADDDDTRHSAPLLTPKSQAISLTNHCSPQQSARETPQ